MIASVVGLYSSPIFIHLKPKKDDTSMTTVSWQITGIYLLKVDIEYTKGRCEICSKLLIMTLERRHWRRSGVFIVIFEHISHFFLVFLMETTLGK